MDTCQAIKTRRTIRLFNQQPISEDILTRLIEAARCAPSAANLQPLEYIIINDQQIIDRVFDQLAWAAYVQPKRNPPAGSRPVAYIVVLVNNEIALEKFGSIDAAAAIENILLAAWADGIGSCWLGSVNRNKVKDILDIPDTHIIDSVIALGYPAEQPEMEDCGDDSIEYYLDSENRLHVPKRPIKKITHINKF